MASVHFGSLWKQSWGLSTSNFIMGQITTVGMMMQFIIPWFATWMVKHPRHWSCLPALHCTMLSWSGKKTKVFIWNLPSQSWKRTDLITQTTSSTRITVVRMHPAALQWVTSYSPCLALPTCIQSQWIPGKHYRRATNRGHSTKSAKIGEYISDL